MKVALCAASLLAVMCVGLAHAELTIWQVENNPPGTDIGNEWMTLINTGEHSTFSGYAMKTTNGRIASHAIPTMTLGMCDYHKITFAKQTIDNDDDTVQLLKGGIVIYETPVIRDTKNDDRFWTNPEVAVACDDRQPGAVAEPDRELPAGTAEDRIVELEEENARLKAENARLKAVINLLQSKMLEIIGMLNGLLNIG